MAGLSNRSSVLSMLLIFLLYFFCPVPFFGETIGIKVVESCRALGPRLSMIRRQPAAEIFLVLFTSLFLQNLREVETYSSALRVEIELEARVITLLPNPPFLNVKIFCFDVLH